MPFRGEGVHPIEMRLPVQPVNAIFKYSDPLNSLNLAHKCGLAWSGIKWDRSISGPFIDN
jgi:hypothetical protein